MAKILRELFNLLPAAMIKGDLDLVVESMVSDSRKASPGALFICTIGSKIDGHNYIDDAHRRGAIAVLVEKEVQIDGITVIIVPDTRAAMQIIAPFFFDYPGRKLRMIGVTGTNGKTTVTYLIRSVLRQAGIPVGLIGTIQTMIGENSTQSKYTTPDVVELQATLAAMVERGMKYVVMEVSSHGLALNRIAGCEFDVGIFTNLGRDHLNFHGTLEKYTLAKVKLFGLLGAPNACKSGKTAVINVDEATSGLMLQKVSCRTITYGINSPANIMAKDIKIRSSGADFTLCGDFGKVPISLKITGMFNIYNVLAAIGALLAEGFDISIICQALEEFTSVPGRFELVQSSQPFSIIVDFAHTPDGLENVLKTARQFVIGKIITIFGCGGDRDRTKRPLMGRVAAEYADVVLATSDNPRSENPETILEEIEAGIKQGIASGGRAKTYEVIIDRRQAIARAIKMAESGDIVMIAGKGHETYQILKDRTIDFDDREVVREIIQEMI